MALLEMIDVTKSYSMGEVTVPALDGINLSIDRGEFVGVTGPSGSGKTTLLNLIAALDAPTSGKILLEGRVISALSASAQDEMRRSTIGLIFQSFNLIPVLTAVENVALPLHLHPISRGQRAQRARATLGAVGLESFADFLPDQLSGGQRQRVAIARALVTEPRLILADEPTASLDSQNAAEIVGLMETLNQDRGCTFVFSTHDNDLLQRVGRIVRIRDGRIVEEQLATKRKAGRSRDVVDGR